MNQGRGSDVERPFLVTLPREDAAFASFVQRCAGELEERGELDRERLQGALRRWHRRATVHLQDELGALSGQRLWYVYRDGTIARVEQGWWRGPGVARVTFGRDGTFREVNDAASRLVGRPSEEFVGARWSDFVTADAAETDAAWLWALLDRGTPIQSVFELPLPDGGQTVIEYYSEPAGETDLFESYWRPVTLVRPGPAGSGGGEATAEDGRRTTASDDGG